MGRYARQLQRLLLVGLLALQCLGAGTLRAQTAPAAESLKARFTALRGSDTGGLLDRSVYLLSTEASGRTSGDVYALVEQPFAEVRHALEQAGHWCGILILHLNVKYCRAATTGGHVELVTGVGRKFEQPLSDVYWARFDFSVSSTSEGYLDVKLQAPTGPLATRDYLIRVEAVPFAERQSLLHMTYAYGYGLAADWAMRTYLATLGRDKQGFSIVGRRADGQPILVGGLRGVLERNTLRYYLAIDAFLRSHALPPAAQLPTTLEDWFAATERFAPQLHELDHDDYVATKVREVHRQQSVAPPPISR